MPSFKILHFNAGRNESLNASPWIHKITRSIPEIWYIAILSVITFSFVYDAIGREWQDSSMLFSEYSEFPDKTVSNAVQLIIGGGLLIGTSLILAVAMWLRGILKP